MYKEDFDIIKVKSRSEVRDESPRRVDGRLLCEKSIIPRTLM